MKHGKNAKQVVEEAWFPGDHSCVGGGKVAKAPLSNRCLLWMLERIKAHDICLATNLKILTEKIDIDHTVAFDNTIRGLYRLTGSSLRSVKGNFDQLDISVKRRWRDCPGYRPKNLSRRFRGKLDNWKE
jgi:hypothetical protein